jgi:CHAT domain-containing protein/tetratricopeptide (TPR) repeat protein
VWRSRCRAWFKEVRVCPARQCPSVLLELLFALILALLTGLSDPAAAAAPEDRTNVLTYIERGADAYRMGDLVAATQRWGEAVRLCRLAGDTSREADVLARRGEAFQSLGQLQASAADFEQALRGAETLGDPVRLAALTGALGNVYFQAHDFDHSRPLLERSLSLAEKARLPTILAATANNLGNLDLANDDVAGAIASYTASIEAAAGNVPLEVTARINKTRALLRQGHAGGAVTDLESALQRSSDLPATSDTAYSQIAIGRVAYQAQSRAARAARPNLLALGEAALQRSLALADRLHDVRAGSLSDGYLAELYEAEGRAGEAKVLTQRAIFQAQQIDAPDLLYQWDWLEGRLERAAGNREVAIEAYRRAVANLQAVRQDIPVDYTEGRSSFREILGPLYLELADLLLRVAADQPNAPNVPILLGEARRTVEFLKTAEIRDYFKDQCLVALESQKVSAANAAQSSRTATLYPIVLPDRVELLAAVGNEQYRVTAAISQASLTAKVRELRRRLETLGTREFFAPAQEIYDWLIRPLAPFLQAHDVDTLIVVPDGPLRTFPFAALYDGKFFLIEHYAIATELGLTLMDPKPIARQPINALLSGLSKPTQGYPGLPFVGGELASLQRMEPASTVLEDEGFRLKRVEDDLQAVPFSVVHIASHAEFSSDPAKTFILTYDGRLTLADLEASVKYRASGDEPLELLTLSACQTAAGDDRAALGLAGVAIKAGARSAVASLWSINDEAASRVITVFYKSLQESNRSKAHALQLAQTALIHDRRFGHPGYWAPFLLIGNWL